MFCRSCKNLMFSSCSVVKCRNNVEIFVEQVFKEFFFVSRLKIAKITIEIKPHEKPSSTDSNLAVHL